GELLLAGGGVPHLHLPPPLLCLQVISSTPRDDTRAVGAERHAVNSISVPLEGELLLAGRGVPHLHLAPYHLGLSVVAFTPRDDARAVGAEGHAGDFAGVPLEGALLLAGGGVPHLHRPVPTPRDDARAVGAEGHAADRAGVPLEGALLLAGGGVPHLHR